MASSNSTTKEQVVEWLRSNPTATDADIRAQLGVESTANRAGPGRFSGGLVRSFMEGVAPGGVTRASTVQNPAAALAAVMPEPLPPGSAKAEQSAFNAYRQKHQEDAVMAQVLGSMVGGAGISRLAAKLPWLTRALQSNKMLTRTLAPAAISGAEGAITNAIQAPVGEKLDAAKTGAAFGVAGGVAASGAGAVGEVLAGQSRAARGVLSTVPTDVEAARLIATALDQDARTPEAIVAAATRTPDVPLSPLDLGGNATRGLSHEAQMVARSEAQDRLEAVLDLRSAGQRDRHIQRLSSVLNPNDEDVTAVLDDLNALRKQHAVEAFGRSLQGPPITDPEVLEFMNVPEVRAAYNAYREGQILRKSEMIPPAIYDEAGELAIPAVPIAAFHFVQQAVQRAASATVRAAGNDLNAIERARALTDRVKPVLGRVEALNPDYAAARSVFRAESAEIDVLQAGRGIAPEKGRTYGRNIPIFAEKTPASEIAKWLTERRNVAAGSGPEAAEAADQVMRYQLGAWSRLRDQIRASSNPSAYLAKPEVQDKIFALFGNPREANEFATALKAETLIEKTARGALTNALPASRGPVQTGGDVILAASGMQSGHKHGALVAIGRLLRGQRTMTPEIANSVMRQLLSGSDGNFQELVNSMQGLQKIDEVRRGRQLARRTALGIGVSSAVRERDQENQ